MDDTTLCAAAASAYTLPADLVAGDVHAVFSLAGRVTTVAFRGTVPTSWEDWLRDLDCRPREHPALGTCHGGFLGGAEALLPALRAVLADGRPFALTGHSLGGALAIAMGGLLLVEGRVPVSLTTFGAPRVGMAQLAGLLARAPGRRYRHGCDCVPDVPTWPWLTDRPWTQIGARGPCAIVDHAIARYAAALAQASTLSQMESA
jgi:fermentation-respiration switch protein FrsA (DUF1100 family)